METLEKMGFKDFGVGGERLDLRDMSDETRDARQYNQDDTNDEAYSEFEGR